VLFGVIDFCSMRYIRSRIARPRRSLRACGILERKRLGRFIETLRFFFGRSESVSSKVSESLRFFDI